MVVVSDAAVPPRLYDIRALHEPYEDDAGKLVTSAIRELRKVPELANVKVEKTYAVLCADEDPNKETIDRCKAFLANSIQLAGQKKPPVILAMGITAVKALGIKAQSLKDVQSRVFTDVLINDVPHTVVVTISPKMLIAMAGLYPTYYSDLRRAMELSIATAPKPKMPIDELTKSYVFPRTIDDVRKLCDEILQYNENGGNPDNWLIAVDTETNTLFPHRDGLKLLCVSVAWATGKAAAIPLWHAETPYDPEQAFVHVKRLLEAPKKKVCHNGKYDYKVFRKMGVRLDGLVWDSMLAEHALEEDKKGQYGLKPLTRVFFPEFTEYADELHSILADEQGDSQLENVRKKQKEAAVADVDMLGADVDKPKKKPGAKKKKGGGGFENIPLDKLLLYAAIDTDMTRRLTVNQSVRADVEERAYTEKRKAVLNHPSPRKHPIPLLCKERAPIRSLVRNIAVPLTPVLADMEYHGIKVDREYMDFLEVELGKVIDKSERDLYALSGKNDLKLNSAAAIANVLFSEGFVHPLTQERVSYEPVTMTKTNQAQTTEKVLKYLVARYSCPFSSTMLIYKKAYKAKNTFIANVRDLSSTDGYLHTNYNIHGTGTGRLSSNDENMQNIPKKLAGYSIKKIFIPSDPSMAFVNCDAKGAEVRIFSAYSQDQELIKSLNDGLDTHCFFADAIVTRVRMEPGADEVLESMGLDNSKPLTYDDFKNRDTIKKTDPKYAEMLDKFRTAIKRVVFGILYGAGSRKIAETIGISLNQAQSIIDMLFQLYPSIPAYIERTKWELNTFGLVETYFGRRRRFSVKGATGYLRSRAERQGVNFKIQSTSSDIVLNCLIGIEKPLINDLRGRLLLTVHDSIGFELPKKYVSQLPDFIDKHLNIKPGTKYPWLPTEFKWDYEIGPNYGEMNSYESYMAGLEKQQQAEVINAAEDAYGEDEVRDELASLE